ncbi:MAG: hypothetical protein PHV28_16345 [Kiritimatiellae bacterium]|nr:hypothetical protein [Kiritimatiellia bacterium]
MRKFLFILSAALLLGVGSFGYMHRNEVSYTSANAVVARGTTWFQKQSIALSAAFRNSALGVSYQKRMRELRELCQQPQAAANQPAARSTAPPAIQTRSVGQRIANGHAFAKHAAQFGFSSRDQLAAHIEQVVRSAGPSNTRSLLRGRTAYWDGKSGTVVIVDPNTADGGTAFKPDRGRRYFEALR